MTSPLLSSVSNNILEIEATSRENVSSNNGGTGREEEEKGISLTWKDLWVTVAASSSKGKMKESKSILDGLTGYAKPGQLLAIMGPSGCGKSTLLDALA
ncbi:ABC transporter G family member 11-like protein, partial [Trifolium pratense]